MLQAIAKRKPPRPSSTVRAKSTRRATTEVAHAPALASAVKEHAPMPPPAHCNSFADFTTTLPDDAAEFGFEEDKENDAALALAAAAFDSDAAAMQADITAIQSCENPDQLLSNMMRRFHLPTTNE